MNTAFYRVWVPVSLLLHALLIVGLALIKLAPPINSSDMDPIVRVFFAPPLENPVPVEELTRPTLPHAAEVLHPGTVPMQIGIPNTGHLEGNDPAEGAVHKAGGPGGDSTTAGPGTHHTAAPPLLNAPNSNWRAPVGVDGGTGTGGQGLGEEGPSYGVAAEGNPHGSSKTAGELNQNGDVWVSVKINEDGSFSAPRITATSGSDRLDDEAVRLVGTWRFTPGMQKGVAVGGAVKLRVSFAHGQYTIAVEK